MHLTAEAVHTRAQARLPEISLATVYNTLNELVAMGEILEVPSAAGAAGAKRYDVNAHVDHHHLICTVCGDLRDVFPAGQDGLGIALDPAARHGFEITGVQVLFQGLCPECRQAAPRSELR